MNSQRHHLALLMDFENLIIGLENNDPTEEKPFSINTILGYLESHYGHVIYRKAFADWSNAKFRKYAMELSRAGVDMQHVVRSGYNFKNASDTHLVIQAMDCMLHYPIIDTFVIVTGDSDFLPLITKLKASAKHVIGLGTQGTIANTLLENCDDYIYYNSQKGLTLKPRCDALPATAPPAVPHRLPAAAGDAAAVVRTETPEGRPPGFDSRAGILPDHHGVAAVTGAMGASQANQAGIVEPPLPVYLQATRWYIRDPEVRDQILRGIFEQLSRRQSVIALGQLREIVTGATTVSDKEWFGTLFSLTYGGCLWEDPQTSELPLFQRGVSLYRGVKTAEEFLTRYYCSLFHKAFGERSDLTALACAELMYPGCAQDHVTWFEEVLTRLAQRQ